MSALSKETARRLLERQIEKIPELKAKNHRAPEFEPWRLQTLRIIKKMFGESSDQARQFESIAFGLFMFSGLTPASEWEEAYRQGLTKAEATLKSFIEELDLFDPARGITSEARRSSPDGSAQSRERDEEFMTSAGGETDRRGRADIVIITALPLEAKALLRKLPSSEHITTRHRVYYRSELTTSVGKYSVVLLCLEGMGNVKAAVAATQAIDVWNPQAVFVVGIAGGLRLTIPDAKLGDVIVAEQIVAYEPGKIKDGIITRRYEVLRPAHSLLVAAQSFARQSWTRSIVVSPPGESLNQEPKVHFGVLLSGEKVVADANFAKDLQEDWSKSIGIDMEGFGVALALYQAENLPGMLQIRGISDWADSAKADRWQDYAAEVAASFTLAFLESHPLPFMPERSQPQRVETVYFSGKHKIRLCQRLGTDWIHLADYYDIPSHDRRTFQVGFECQSIWQWLGDREKLSTLPSALDFIGRSDLVKLLSGPI